MRYKDETIKKVVADLKASVADYKARLDNGEQLTVSISGGNRKIGHVLNVSLAPILCCGNCKECKYVCYDIKACVRYSGTKSARAKNTVIARYDRKAYFDAINKKMDNRRKNKYFRYHVAGDILDYDYFDQMVQSAISHPDFIVWTYTKMYKIVNEWISKNGSLPANFIVMFSKWDGMPMDNPYGLPVFACKLADGNKDTTDAEFSNMYKCPGNCNACKAGRRGCIGGENTYCDEH